jgi:endonuclease YncB( thermonuclease family)
MEIKDNYVRNIFAIIDVHDGDTIKALVETGFDVLSRVTFRLAGINTAEVKKKQSEERVKLGLNARDYVKEITSKYKSRVVSERFESGGFGRYLGVVFYEKDGNWINLNQELLDLKLAQTYYLGASKEQGEFKTE